MGSIFNFANMFGGGDDENLTRGPRNPLLRNLYASNEAPEDIGDEYQSTPSTANMLSDAVVPPLDQEDPAAKMYLERANQPLPSEGLLKDYLSRQPHQEDYKSNIWQKIGAGLFGAFGQQGAAQRLLHPGYERSLSDWQTEGKLVPQMARSADTARAKSLEAERFNIIGTAKKRQQDEIERKNKALEDAKQKAAADKAAKDVEEKNRRERTDRRLEEGSLRAERAATRAEENASRATQREQRLEEADKRTAAKGELDKKTSEYKRELEDLDETVGNEIANNPHWKQYFTIDKDGNTSLTDEGKAAGIAELHKFMVSKRKKALQQKYGLSGE